MPRRDTRSIERARLLRREASPAEVMLWSRLRGRRLGGIRFRRQHPIGPLVVDFACPEAMVVVELDSSYHDGRCEADAGRDAVLHKLGWSVLRVTASELTRDEAIVLRRIHDFTKHLLPAGEKVARSMRIMGGDG